MHGLLNTRGATDMEALIIFAVAIAAIWTPHLIAHAVMCARYHHRVRTGYLSPVPGDMPAQTPSDKLALFDACLKEHAKR